MPRRRVPLYPSQYYHPYNRGNNRGRIFLEEENHLFFLRNVHLKPVVAGLAKEPSAWPFSSYRDYIGERTGHLPHPDIVLSYFESPDADRQFVEEQVRQSDGELEWRNALFAL